MDRLVRARRVDRLIHLRVYALLYPSLVLSWPTAAEAFRIKKKRECLFCGTARVSRLEFCDLLIVQWHRRTAVSLFADEVVFDRWLVTAEALHSLKIHCLVSPGLDFGTLCREVKIKKLPAGSEAESRRAVCASHGG